MSHVRFTLRLLRMTPCSVFLMIANEEGETDCSRFICKSRATNEAVYAEKRDVLIEIEVIGERVRPRPIFGFLYILGDIYILICCPWRIEVRRVYDYGQL